MIVERLVLTNLMSWFSPLSPQVPYPSAVLRGSRGQVVPRQHSHSFYRVVIVLKGATQRTHGQEMKETMSLLPPQGMVLHSTQAVHPPHPERVEMRSNHAAHPPVAGEWSSAATKQCSHSTRCKWSSAASKQHTHSTKGEWVWSI